MRQSLMRAVCVVVLQFGLIITDIQLLSVPHAGPLTRTHNWVGKSGRLYQPFWMRTSRGESEKMSGSGGGGSVSHMS